MDYWEAKKAEHKFREFQRLAESYWAARPEAGENEESSNLRDQLNAMLPEVTDYSVRIGCARIIEHIPPPMIGGPILRIPVLDLVVSQDIGNHLSQISLQEVRDVLNQYVGAATKMKTRAWARVSRPWNWPVALIGWLIRAPFAILRRAGLPAKVEENLISQVIKVILLLGVLAILAYFGLSAADVVNVLK